MKINLNGKKASYSEEVLRSFEFFCIFLCCYSVCTLGVTGLWIYFSIFVFVWPDFVCDGHDPAEGKILLY